MTVTGGDFAFRDARKELGLGQPPDAFGSDANNFLADSCSPTAKITIVEVARGRSPARSSCTFTAAASATPICT